MVAYVFPHVKKKNGTKKRAYLARFGFFPCLFTRKHISFRNTQIFFWIVSSFLFFHQFLFAFHGSDFRRWDEIAGNSNRYEKPSCYDCGEFNHFLVGVTFEDSRVSYQYPVSSAHVIRSTVFVPSYMSPWKMSNSNISRPGQSYCGRSIWMVQLDNSR